VATGESDEKAGDGENSGVKIEMAARKKAAACLSWL